MTLADYVHGRVIFAGDAAHLLPIFGVRGANTGWQDGHNVAWKLAMALRGVAGPKLLGSYSQERVAAAREIIDEASKSTRFMTPPSPGFKLLRDAALSLALTQAFVRPLLYWRTSRPHDYVDSALNTLNDDDRSFTAGPARGQVIRNVRLAPGEYLMDRLGASFHLFWFGADGSIPGAVAEAAERIRAVGVPLAIAAIRRHGSGPVGGAELVIDDPAGRMHDRYGVNGPLAAYLVRPDQHVCARWLTPDAQSLTQAIDQALGRR
jgi:3-(3-hydroxy-phenyl)propionate hydroxylase